ncbi:MAG: glycoside hydrolase family 5 protein [Verrucomicrobiaceae bacterium]|nr:glycoside hydrolase family 5 protein [Verrucomicrobiaceae bacterium]
MRPALILVLPLFVHAADPGPPTADNPNWFPFPISVMESSKTAIDLSFLNDKPAGASGFLKAEGEHIVDAKGRPVRLFGTNFCGGACFPEAADAEKVAAHLSKNGINVVRLHHMDNDWNESLIEDNATTGLNAANLGKLDKLVAEFIKNGIYINLNLHVSRTYPGTPKDAPHYSKGLDHFHPPFIEAFKSYTRQILEHVNPHTGRAYKDEPGVAVIEMNNENSLVLNPWWMSKLEEPFAGELRALFIKYLRGKYPTIEKLREVWGLNDGSTGPDLIKNGCFADGTKSWFLESNFGAKSQAVGKSGTDFQSVPGEESASSSPKSNHGPLTSERQPSRSQNAPGASDSQRSSSASTDRLQACPTFLRWTSTQSGKEGYSLQFSQSGLALEESKAYRLSFRARSEKKAALDVHAQNSAPPWAQLGMQEKMQLTPEWQSFAFEFSPHSVLPDGKNRIVFSLLNAVTSVDITEVKLVSISTGLLKPGHTFEAGNIPIPSRNAKLEVRRDFFDFLMQLEIDHALAMKKFIREEIGAKQMITHTALLFGGIVGARREFIVSDIVDTHGYWHHPSFPHKPWDMNDWTINNVSQVASDEGGTLAEMAMQRPFGKPYSVSEYDTPAPNDFAAETFPLFAAMACLQDWSAIYHFNFKHSAKYDSDKITSFFDLPGHPAKQAFMPLAALVFRRELMKPAGATYTLPLTQESILQTAAAKAGDVWGAWRDVWEKSMQGRATAWMTRTGFDFNANAMQPQATLKLLPQNKMRALIPAPVAQSASSPEPFDGAPIENVPSFDGGVFLGINTPVQAAAVVRLQGGVEFDYDGVGASVSADAPQILMMAALDGKTLNMTKKLWLCALSRAENQGMAWDKDRRTVSSKWGTGPALVLGVKAKIKLPGDATWKVEALDPTGTPKAVIAEKTNEFRIDPSQKTVWWLMTRE